MAARHKNQHAQLSVTTTLRGDDVAELARQAAAGVKSSIPGQPFIRYEGSEDDTLVFSIRHLGGHVGLMSFAVKIEAGASGETSAHTRIQAFKTVQSHAHGRRHMVLEGAVAGYGRWAVFSD